MKYKKNITFIDVLIMLGSPLIPLYIIGLPDLFRFGHSYSVPESLFTTVLNVVVYCIVVFFICLMLYALYRGKRYYLFVSESGITEKWPFKKAHTINWNEVEHVYVSMEIPNVEIKSKDGSIKLIKMKNFDALLKDIIARVGADKVKLFQR